jgi:hypothetical protein
MSFDMNDAEPQKSGELIPDGAHAKLTMHIRPGGIDGFFEADRGLLKASSSPGSDVQSIDAELTVVEGPHKRRKFWQTFTVRGGKLDDKGQSIGWGISKSTFRAMIDSALGLDPNDTSEAAKSKRVLRGLADLSGITFVGKIRIEASQDPRYGDSNRLDRVILPNEPIWQKVMNGEAVPDAPTGRGRAAAQAPARAAPAWSTAPAAPAAQAPAAAAPPAWSTTLAVTPAPAAPAQPQPQAPAQPAGPAWLNS